MKQYHFFLFICITSVTTIQTMFDDGEPATSMVVHQPGSSPARSENSDGFDANLHTLDSPNDPHARRRRSRTLLEELDEDQNDDGGGVGPSSLHRSLSLASESVQPIYEDSDLDLSQFKLVDRLGRGEYQERLNDCVVSDRSELQFLERRHMLINSAALGLGTSVFFWIRNLDLPSYFGHARQLSREPGTRTPLLILAGAKAALSAGSSLALPMLTFGGGVWLWHQLKEKVLQEEELKKLKKEMKVKDGRIGDLTKGLEKSKETVERMADDHEQYVRKQRTFLGEHLNQLVGLQAILGKIDDKQKKEVIVSAVHKKAVPQLATIITAVQTNQQDMSKYLDDEEYAAEHHEKKGCFLKRGFKKFTHLFHRH